MDNKSTNFRHHLLTGVSAFTLAYAASMVPAHAQDTDAAADDTDDVEEIVVTGIRASLGSARDLKREADTAIDSITAADVGGLPDLSVAEALARIPGVTVQRIGLGASDGDFPSPEGGDNLIRGLQLVRSEWNGRDAFSANGGRSLDFGTIPPELIGSVDVYKNSSADLIPGGIGGTINLRTLEPFDKDGRFAVVTVDGTYTDLRKKVTPDLSIIAGDRWETSGGEFGVLASFSTSELKSDLQGFQIGQLYPINIGGENVAIPGGFQLRTNEVDRSRDSYYGALQWRSSDESVEVVAKYARIENTVTSDERTLEWFGDGEMWALTNVRGNNFSRSNFSSPGLPQCNGSNDPTPSDPTCEMTQPVTGLYQSGIISNDLRDWTGSRGANASTLGIHQEDKSMTSDLSLNIKWRPSDSWFVNVDAHHTKATSSKERLWAGGRVFTDFVIKADLDDPILRLVPDAENDPFRINNNDNCQWAGCGTPLSTELDDPANTFMMFAADEFQDNEGDLTAVKADLEYEFNNDGWFDAVKFGGRYAEREQINRSAGLNWAGVSPPWAGGYYLGLDQLGDGNNEVVDFADFFRGGVVRGPETAVTFVNRDLLSDYDAYVAAIDAVAESNAVDWNPLRRDGVVDYSRGTIGDVTEKTTEFYGRLDFGNEFSNGMSIDGNIGVRYTKSSVSGQGALDFVPIGSADAITFLPETTAYFNQASVDRSGKFSSVDYWLPSLNLKLNLDDRSLIRFAASKAITRPDISQLRSSQSQQASFRFVTDTSTTPSTVIDVIPSVINVFGGNPDLEAIESWNFDLSYEYYFGEQDSFTFGLFKKDITNNIIYESTTIGTVTLDGTEVAIVYNGDLNQDTADIKGVEVAYQQFYDFLPGIFGNLGLQANYTYIDASTNAPLPVADADGDGTPDSFERIYRYGVDEYLGLSKHTANLIGIYQDDKFEFRLAYNWRSSHLSSYRDFITGNPIFQQSRGYLDASFKYAITDYAQFRLQVANITNTIAKADQQIDATGQRFGRTAFMGDRRIKAGIRFEF